MTEYEEIMARWYGERSGPGSTVEFSKPYRDFVENFIYAYQIKRVLDLGCGDGVIASHINWQGAAYLGVDCIRERVDRNRKEYPQLDFEHSDLRLVKPQYDLVLVKDVIQHWPLQDVVEWLAMFVKCEFKYALITNCNYAAIEPVNSDVPLGGWRPIDLTAPPFSVGKVVLSWGVPNKDVVLVRGMGL